MVKYWFKLKKYGWGWVPLTWEGWAVLLGFIFWTYYIVKNYTQELMYLLLIFSAIILYCIASIKGPKPKWSWG